MFLKGLPGVGPRNVLTALKAMYHVEEPKLDNAVAQSLLVSWIQSRINPLLENFIMSLAGVFSYEPCVSVTDR